MTTKLLDLLSRYIKEYKRIEEKINHKINTKNTYEELLKMLKENGLENIFLIPLKLKEIYKNDIYIDEFSEIISHEDREIKLKIFIEKIKLDYDILLEEIDNLINRKNRNKELVASANRVITNIKYNTKISGSKNDIENIKKIISYYQLSGIISNREELQLINEIELHNLRLYNRDLSDNQEPYSERLYKDVSKVVAIGFQPHDEIIVQKERKNTLDQFVNQIKGRTSVVNDEEIIDTIEEYKKYNLYENEYRYIIVKVLDDYIDELITIYQLLMEKEIYSDITERMYVVKNYNKILEKYLIIKNYYEYITKEELEKYYETEIDEVTEEELEEESVEINETKQLIYSHANANINKAKIISDMDDVPHEYYETVLDLLNRFKNGTISNKEIKALSNYKGISKNKELKYDQVRVVFVHVKDNIYNIFGVFVKKADNDRITYEKMCDRMIPNVDTEENLKLYLNQSEKVERELEEMVKTKGRKGRR